MIYNNILLYIIIKSIAIYIGFPLELDHKTIQLKKPRITGHGVTGHGDITLFLIRKLPPCWLAFIILEGAM